MLLNFNRFGRLLRIAMIYGMLNNKGTIGSLKCQSSPALSLEGMR